jgi:hypothetical protein
MNWILPDGTPLKLKLPVYRDLLLIHPPKDACRVLVGDLGPPPSDRWAALCIGLDAKKHGCWWQLVRWLALTEEPVACESCGQPVPSKRHIIMHGMDALDDGGAGRAVFFANDDQVRWVDGTGKVLNPPKKKGR